MADPLLTRLCRAVLEDDADDVAAAALVAELVRRERARLVPRDWGEVQVIPRLSPDSLVVLSTDRDVDGEAAARIQQHASDCFGCRTVLLPMGLSVEVLIADHAVPAETIGDPDWWREQQAWHQAHAANDLDAPPPVFESAASYPLQVVGDAPQAGSWNVPVESPSRGRTLVERQLGAALEHIERRQLRSALHAFNVARAVAVAMQDTELVERVRAAWREAR